MRFSSFCLISWIMLSAVATLEGVLAVWAFIWRMAYSFFWMMAIVSLAESLALSAAEAW